MRSNLSFNKITTWTYIWYRIEVLYMFNDPLLLYIIVIKAVSGKSFISQSERPPNCGKIWDDIMSECNRFAKQLHLAKYFRIRRSAKKPFPFHETDVRSLRHHENIDFMRWLRHVIRYMILCAMAATAVTFVRKRAKLKIKNQSRPRPRLLVTPHSRATFTL